MENLGLTDVEKQYFAELFASCDVENQGRVSGSKATELLLASQLSSDVLAQITELCGARRLGHFGRSQFYIALKLIALAQTGAPPKLELLASGVDIPLPKFGKPIEINEKGSANTVPIEKIAPNSQMPGQLPPPPSTAKSRSGSGQRQGSLPDTSPSHHNQLPSVQPSASMPVPPPPPPSHLIAQPSVTTVIPAASPSNEIPAASPSTTASQNDKRWTAFNNDIAWAHFEEHHHLLGNEEDSSERHSSDEDADYWTITEEQRDYYTKQFKSMQPDLKGKISGSVAKDFFEKSKLPVHELSKIWHFSDLDKDGMLTLEEFCIAMHLVVLRRHNIELPDALPPSLLPKKWPLEDDGARYANIPPAGTTSPPPATSVPSISTRQPQTSPPAEVVSPPNKEWTKFNDSPNSSMSSPVAWMKPVNFDFPAASVEQDPMILHPVAVRLSPDGQPLTNDVAHVGSHIGPENEINNNNKSSVQRPMPRKPSGPNSVLAMPPQPPSSNLESENVANSTHVKEPRRSSFSGPASSLGPSTNAGDNTSQSQQSAILLSTVPSQQLPGPKKDPPPPPPPRPRYNHTRSSSLDLNKLGQTVPHFLHGPPPPAIPPRLSPCSGTPRNLEDDQSEFVADFTRMDKSPSPLLKTGAFEVYKKQTHLSESSGAVNADQISLHSALDDAGVALLDDHLEGGDRKRHLSAPPLALAATQMINIPRDKKELQAAIQAHRARNQMLSIINTDLNQELSETMEERIALEIQLDHMKPS